jgi:hypothetical protein
MRQTLFGFEDAEVVISKHPQGLIGADDLEKLEEILEK